MTKKFNVQAHYIVYLEVEIDAETENAAWEKAQDLFGELTRYLPEELNND